MAQPTKPSIVALYAGRNPKSVRLLAATTDAEIVALVADRLQPDQGTAASASEPMDEGHPAPSSSQRL